MSPPHVTTTRNCFNPHPTRTPGATGHCAPGLHRRKVSTLTRRERQVRPRVREVMRQQDRSFNPHPTRTPGATHSACRRHTGDGVSTLTRRERQVRPLLAAHWSQSSMFQPSPDANARCDCDAVASGVSLAWFQPSPDANARCDHLGNAGVRGQLVFQPSPDANARCDVLLMQ